MAIADWLVIAGYLFAMLVLAWFLGRKQQSRTDYFLASGNLPDWAIATSIVATQCSTNSLLGAPAFVGFAIGGGLIWLQYELAVPLAMLLLCFLFLPIRSANVISIYAFLEERLGTESRLIASSSFLFFRGIATGVTIYGIGSVIALITGTSYFNAVFILMGITITYDLMGGMRAVIISDVVQMVLLSIAVIISLLWLAEPLATHFDDLAGRGHTLVNDWGLASGNNYGFWPMLFGGLFLYMAYYGCDQSQAQRLLSSASTRDTQKVLVINGLIRFPLVLAYCFLGLALAAYAIDHPLFVEQLPKTALGEANINLVFPSFVLQEFAPGLSGLAIVGLLAAAMSSIDSALNSLSASTVEDFIARRKTLSENRLFLYSKFATAGWGLFAVAFSFQVENIAATVLEAINKIGSIVNGPLLALFSIAVFLPQAGQRAALAGFFGGVLVNIYFWLALPSVSWLWWNVFGFAASVALTVVIYSVAKSGEILKPLAGNAASMTVEGKWVATLISAFALMFSLTAFLHFSF